MKRTKHSLSYYNLTSCDMGQLVPVGLSEVLPGDTINQATSALIRVSPLVTPVMHPVTVRLHHWFVPHRLTWPEFEDFITGGPDGNNAEQVPRINGPSIAASLDDYMGIPPGTEHFSALPRRAYNLIWNEWYRDQDLQDERDSSEEAIAQCAWEKDYFTAARPFTQKGDAVTLPIGARAPVTGIGVRSNASVGGADPSIHETGGDGIVGYDSQWPASASDTIRIEEDPDNPGFPNIYADLSAAGAVDVNDFRQAFALQRYKEARARYGSRYTEYLQYLGVRSADSRLQRPEYLGGGKQTISFSEVLQTGEESAATEQKVGTMRGHGIAALRSNRYRKFFSEHGYVMTLMSVRPKTMYANGVPRHFLRQSKEDFYQKELEAIGQQEVLNKEVKNDHTYPNGVFGYTNRYEEYRKNFSIVSAEMRDILDSWHLARDFETDPALNDEFVTCDPTKRIYAVQTNDVLWCMVNHSIQARRMVNKHAQSRIL